MMPPHEWSPSKSSVSSSSPPRPYEYNNMQHNYSNYTTYFNSRQSRSPSNSPSGSERMFVTCGGQVVAFMEGVVNMPQVDFDMLTTL